MDDTIKKGIHKPDGKSVFVVDLSAYLPTSEELVSFDLADFLFQRFVLKEKDFRKSLKEIDWTLYTDKYVQIFCSSDAIVPMWAYMLVVNYIQPYALSVFSCHSREEAEERVLLHKIANFNIDTLKGERVAIKGCGERKLSPEIYTAISSRLMPIVKALSYGEVCSLVPIYKQV